MNAVKGANGSSSSTRCCWECKWRHYEASFHKVAVLVVPKCEVSPLMKSVEFNAKCFSRHLRVYRGKFLWEFLDSGASCIFSLHIFEENQEGLSLHYIMI
ncbi:hypothetical protein CDAR_577491 [Caerostris darwini]|uniref:Uncharacterized protein n=1 Tax=Caerostris darwini TaxID=1538125 RepID=A0AAV4QBN6_9ARAC|nr:hypothetical protein CDAR_577491 [Caerostris darwini]